MLRSVTSGVVVLAVAGSASAQTAPIGQFEFTQIHESGAVSNKGRERASIWSTVVADESASWLRLDFEIVVLGEALPGGLPTLLRITSLTDGAVQSMEDHHVTQWRSTSAYFNGSAVLVEVLADPGSAPSRVRIHGGWGGVLSEPAADTICGTTDDRALSTDPRIGRTMPLGCTAWMIDDANHNFLTAGHCDVGLDVVQFNVPLSTAGGAYLNPPPQHQYAVDDTSVQTQSGSKLIGNDWCFFGCFPNSSTGLKPWHAQGSWFTLVMPSSPTIGQEVTVTGYGTVDPPVPLTWNGVQKVHAGPYVSFAGNTVAHAADTTGGNSGSPIILDDLAGTAIGIHTNGGCSSGGGSNKGTGVNNPDLQAAIANPQGICLLQQEILFSFPNGIPDELALSGATIRVQVAGQNFATPQAGSGQLHYDLGSGFVAVPMVDAGANLYDAVFPDLPCGATVSFYFSAENLGDEVFFEPVSAPAAVYSRIAASAVNEVYAENFQDSSGWTVTNDLALSDGAWDFGVPVGGGDRGDPPTDADGSGACALTDNVDGNTDVDGGTTTLVSPLLDASDPGAVLVYYRWYNNVGGGDPENDIFTVEVSDDDGASWHLLETVGPAGPEVAGGWFHETFPVAEMVGVAPSSMFRVRFNASDLGTGSLIEAGVDGVQILTIECEDPGVLGDVDGDGLVRFDDLIMVLNAWGPCPGCPEDIDGNGSAGFSDVIIILNEWS